MRIALCYRGRADGYSKGNRTRAFEGQFEKVKKFIGQDHDFDVFVHCWSPTVKDKLVDIYDPVKYIIEEEKKFDDRFDFGIENIKAKGDTLKEKKEQWAPHHKLSVMYSICETLKLKSSYEKENKFKYDAVFLLRYDLDFFDMFDYSEILANPSTLYYSVPYRAINKIYQYKNKKAPYTRLHIWDHWFAGSSDAIDILSESFDTMRNDAWYWDNRSLSMHVTWDRFFQLSGLDKDNIRCYNMHKKHISILTRFTGK